MLRLPAVKGKTGHRSHASVYNDIRDGLLTRPVPIGTRAVGWPEDEVDLICAARVAGKSKDEIKDLVKLLHNERSAKFERLMGDQRTALVNA